MLTCPSKPQWVKGKKHDTADNTRSCPSINRECVQAKQISSRVFIRSIKGAPVATYVCCHGLAQFVIPRKGFDGVAIASSFEQGHEARTSF
jgi:hypothetical protein